MDNTNPPPEVPPSFLMEKVLKLNSILDSLNLKPQSSYSRVVCKKEMDSDVMLIELIKDDEYPSGDDLNKDDDVGEEEFEGNHFDKFPTCSELAYHKYLAFGRRLEEIYVTWAHLEKKWIRLRTYTNISQDCAHSGWRRRHQLYTTSSQPTS
ncbi:hypothetical protein Tco_0007368 [Tanacetum coccineum]